MTVRGCARPDCRAEGTHKVPKSRENLGEHLWFCLEHARAHNESWDYFRGMNEAEIEAFRIAALTGHRPTWKVDAQGSLAGRTAPCPIRSTIPTRMASLAMSTKSRAPGPRNAS